MFLEKGREILFRKSIPPNGFVINGIFAPIKTTKPAAKIFTKIFYKVKRHIYHPALLLSKKKDAISNEIIIFDMGRKIRLAVKAPIKAEFLLLLE